MRRKVAIVLAACMTILLALGIRNYPIYYIFKYMQVDTINEDLSYLMDDYSIKYIARSNVLANPQLRISAIYTIPKIDRQNGQGILTELLRNQGDYLYSPGIVAKVLSTLSGTFHDILDDRRSTKEMVYGVLYLEYQDEKSLNELLKAKQSANEELRIDAEYSLSRICNKRHENFCENL